MPIQGSSCAATSEMRTSWVGTRVPSWKHGRGHVLWEHGRGCGLMVGTCQSCRRTSRSVCDEHSSLSPCSLQVLLICTMMIPE